MNIERDISDFTLRNAQWFPIIAVTGPRQSGKSTLVQTLFPNYEYVNLEDESMFNLASASCSDFITERPSRMIVDEAQRLPELFRAIQVASDRRGEAGQYVLSGSQNFLLRRQISQTLAGRVGTIRLLPFSYGETLRVHDTLTPDAFMITGGYPRLHVADIPPKVFFANYLATYVERDVTGYLDARSIASFRKLLSLCAQCTGSLLNVSRLASDTGVARATIESWLSLLESSYVVFRLQPYFANIRKRLVKTPKLYFWDTGLLCHLLGVETSEQLRDSPLRGEIFENLVISELMKAHFNAGEEPRLFFYRDDNKVEVGVIDCTKASKPELIEIKAGIAFKPSFTKGLSIVGDVLGISPEHRHVVTRAQESAKIAGAHIWAARDWLLRDYANISKPENRLFASSAATSQ